MFQQQIVRVFATGNVSATMFLQQCFVVSGTKCSVSIQGLASSGTHRMARCT